MVASVLRSVDLEVYGDLLRELLPEGSRCVLTDIEGIVSWGDERFPAAIAARIAAELGAAEGAASAGTPAGESFRVKGRAFYAAPILAEQGIPIAILMGAAPDGAKAASLGPLATAARCLSRDMALGSELDAMATELAERYEELNLVYHTEDQVSYFAEGQQALEQLVINCCEYLNVGLTVLIMKEKGLYIDRQSEDELIEDAQLVVDRIGADLYEKVVDTQDPVIINNLTSPDASALWHGMAYKVLATPVFDSKGNANGVLVITNPYAKPDFSNSDKNLLQVMARKAAKIVQVNYDPLTGLVNREGLEFFAERLFGDARSDGTVHCALHFDIDQLHVINDTVSTEAGDAVIKAIADQIRRGVRDTDVVSHMGADTFGVLLQKCSLERGTDVAEKLREGIVDLVIPWTDRSLTATVSVGVAPIDEDTETAAAALAAAELACDAAKEMGKNRVQRYYHGDTALKRRHHEMESVGTIQSALQEDHFELYAQVIEPLTNQHHGLHFEVLLRLRSDDGDCLPPGAFMPAAERYHLMPEIDRWVIRKTLAFLDERWGHLTPEPSLVSINLSGQTLGEPGFAEFLSDALSDLRVPLDRICFEITETAAVADLDVASAFMSAVKKRGCRFALDDFGSGLSSFGYLRSLPVDYLKIDGSFVKEIAKDEVAASMVAAVHQVAAVMGLETIAEFVEDDAIKDRLKEIGVTFAQGYGIGKPKPLAAHFHASSEKRETVAT